MRANIYSLISELSFCIIKVFYFYVSPIFTERGYECKQNQELADVRALTLTRDASAILSALRTCLKGLSVSSGLFITKYQKHVNKTFLSFTISYNGLITLSI